MPIMARRPLHQEALNPDKFNTTAEQVAYLREHVFNRVVPNAPFLLVTRFVHHGPAPMSRAHDEYEDQLRVEHYLGCFGSTPVAYRDGGIFQQSIHVGSRHTKDDGQFLWKEEPIVISIGDLSRTPIKGPYIPPPDHFGSRVGEKVEAFSLAIGLPEMEVLMLAELKQYASLVEWFLGGCRDLKENVLSPQLRGLELEARKNVGREIAEVYAKALLTTAKEEKIPSDVREKVRGVLARACRLGMNEMQGSMEVGKFRFWPKQFIESLALVVNGSG